MKSLKKTSKCLIKVLEGKEHFFTMGTIHILMEQQSPNPSSDACRVVTPGWIVFEGSFDTQSGVAL
jgi:hypothetical protein